MDFEKIPAPRTSNWIDLYGSWEGFKKEIHRSIGRNLGGGTIQFIEESLTYSNSLDNKQEIMKLASIEVIEEIFPHSNADSLEFVKVSGFDCIVRKDSHKVGDKVVFIGHDAVLPDQPWAEVYKKFCKTRVKSIKIRGLFSLGVVEKPENIGLDISNLQVGDEVSHLIGVIKYEAPVPQEQNAKGNLPHGLFRTDESNIRGLRHVPYGERVLVTQKIDGKSATYYCKKTEEGWSTGICSRSLEIDPTCDCDYTRINEKYDILPKLQAFCEMYNVSLAIRGEIYGGTIQNFAINPHKGGSIQFAAFSILNLDTLSYERLGSPLFFTEVCGGLNIPTVPILEETILTKELVEQYSKVIEEINGKPFEGVVVQTDKMSAKILSMAYDSKK